MALGQFGYTRGAECLGSKVELEMCGSLEAPGGQGGTLVSKGLKLKGTARIGWSLWTKEGLQWREENWAF